ncbi:MAG: hypothetical protein JJU45_00855 [Acidimicrobiia bacterium]|nr:hypothetical protein [Acidimicrobiia bacterium]
MRAPHDGPALVPAVDAPKLEEEDAFRFEFFHRMRPAAMVTWRQLAEEPDDLRSLAYWTSVLGRYAMPLEVIFRYTVPGFERLAIGFLDEGNEGLGFGFIVYTRSWNRSEMVGPEPVRMVDFERKLRRLGIGSDAWESPRFFHLDPALAEQVRSFTWIVERPCTVEPHRGPSVHPAAGTGSCFARTRVLGPSRQEGVVTARHAVGDAGSRGDPVPLADGRLGELSDMAPGAIDVCVVSTGEAMSNQKLGVQPHVVPWSKARILTRQGALTTRVVDVSNGYGLFNATERPLYVNLENWGQPSDSGSLVVEASTGDGIGIYLGRLDTPPPSNASVGYAAHLYQAAVLMGMQLFR